VSSDFTAFASHRPFCDSICNTLHKIGKIRGPSQGLTVGKTVHILVRAAESAKHDANSRKIAKHFSDILGRLETLAIAAMKIQLEREISALEGLSPLTCHAARP
jgi:hypothetical protein